MRAQRGAAPGGPDDRPRLVDGGTRIALQPRRQDPRLDREAEQLPGAAHLVRLRLAPPTRALLGALAEQGDRGAREEAPAAPVDGARVAAGPALPGPESVIERGYLGAQSLRRPLERSPGQTHRCIAAATIGGWNPSRTAQARRPRRAASPPPARGGARAADRLARPGRPRRRPDRGRLRPLRRRRAPRRPGSRPGRQVEEGPRRGDRDRAARAGARADPRHAARTAPSPARARPGRAFPTSCSSSTRPSRCARRWSGSAASRTSRSSRSSPAGREWRYRNKAEYSFGADRDAPAGLALGFHARGRWDRVVDVDDCKLASERQQRRPQRGPRLGPRARHPRLRQRPAASACSATSSSARAAARARSTRAWSPARPRSREPPTDLHTVVSSRQRRHRRANRGARRRAPDASSSAGSTSTSPPPPSCRPTPRRPSASTASPASSRTSAAASGSSTCSAASARSA